MKRLSKRKTEKWIFGVIGLSLLLMNTEKTKAEVVNLSGSSSHIGTFEESTTFVTMSSNGVNPGLFIEVMDRYGKLTQYESEEGVITIPETKEGAYVTQAKLLGKTKYRDVDTNEILDAWEEGRNLKLVSVENPELKTVGKNLFDINSQKEYNGLGVNDVVIKNNTIEVSASNEGVWKNVSFRVKVKQNTQYTFSVSNRGYTTDGFNFIAIYTAGGSPIANTGSNNNNNTLIFTTPDDCIEIIIRLYATGGDDKVNVKSTYENPMLEENGVATSYKPYQSSVLIVSEEVELRQAGEVQDEVELVNGRFIQRIGEVLLDGNESWDFTDGDMVGGMNYLMNSNNDVHKNVSTFKLTTMSDVIPSIAFTDVWNERLEGLSTSNSDRLGFRISTAKFETADEFKTFLSLNPLTVQYHKAVHVNQEIFISSNYYFKPVTDRDIYVKGRVFPLVCSITVPTEDLTFVLNPNEEEGKQFVAPTFSVINETPTSIFLELRSFSQETDVFNDVLPTKYSDWSQLSKDESKDFALAILPIASDNWITIEEGPRYVAEDKHSFLGEVKAKSTVDFTFTASHGQAFTEMLEPVYKLVFVFDF